MRQKLEALETIETHAEAYRAHTETLSCPDLRLRR